MTDEERNKEISVANMLIGIMEKLEVPMLLYQTEKNVVKNALENYVKTLGQTNVPDTNVGNLISRQAAISELQPLTDDWENYADRLYDLAYLSGYNDGLIAKRGE